MADGEQPPVEDVSDRTVVRAKPVEVSDRTVVRAKPVEVSDRTVVRAKAVETPVPPADGPPDPPSGGPPPTIPLPVRLLLKSATGRRLLPLLIRLPPWARRPVVILVPLLLIALVIAIVVVIVQLVF